MPNWEIYQEAYKRGILPDDKKTIYEEAIKRGLIPSTEKVIPPTEVMANIPPLTPQQELGMPTQTPEEQEKVKQEALHFMWPGAKTAKEHFIKGITPALGMAGAATATALSPSPWSPALGYAAGERAGRGIETLTGVSKPETPAESALATGTDIALGLLPYGIQKAPSVAKQIMNYPLSQKGKIKNVFNVLGGKMEPLAAGESAVGEIKQFYKKVHNQGNQLFENWKKSIPKDTTIEMKNLYNTIDNILVDETSTPAERTFANKILSRISPERGEAVSGRSMASKRFGMGEELEREVRQTLAERGEAGVITKPASIEGAYSTRGMISKETTQKGRVGWRARQMMSSINQDFTDTTEKLGIPEVKENAQKAINFWRDKVVPQGEILDVVENMSPEKIPVKFLMKDVKTVNQLKNAMSPENFQNVKQGFVTKIAESEKNNPLKVGQKLRVMMAKNKEVMEATFTPEELQAIRLSADPTATGRWFEEHPKSKWLMRFIGYGAMYGTLGYGAMRRLFHAGP